MYVDLESSSLHNPAMKFWTSTIRPYPEQHHLLSRVRFTTDNLQESSLKLDKKLTENVLAIDASHFTI